MENENTDNFLDMLHEATGNMFENTNKQIPSKAQVFQAMSDYSGDRSSLTTQLRLSTNDVEAMLNTSNEN